MANGHPSAGASEKRISYPLSPGEYLRLTARDTGKGIPAEAQDKIFDPFFTTKGPGEGSGIGMAVVHGIMQKHGGGITVESETGRGTTFQLLFPRSREEAKVRKEKKPGFRTGTGRIMFVDDEKMQVEVAQRVLEKLGYNVVSVTSSPQALELFRENPNAFDLVITDFSMPDLTGTQLAKEMLNIRPEAPIILSTGYGDILDIKAAEELGIHAFLLKPYSIQEISEKIHEVLDKY